MKKMVLIAYRKTTRDYYLKQLRQFFGQYAEITGYCSEEGIGDTSDADVVLFTGVGISDTMKVYTDTKAKIIYMKRTYSNDSFGKLFDLPSGVTAMFVCNDRFSAHESVAILNSIGNRHINLVPVYPEIDEVPNLEYAVTPAQTFDVPAGVKHVIDIGWRVISTSTMLDIATTLDILDKTLHTEILKRQSEIMPLNMGMQYMIENSNLILNMTRGGIVYTDEDFIIKDYNDSILKFFGVAKYLGASIMGTLIPNACQDHFTKNEEVLEIVFEHPEFKRTFEVSKRALMISEKKYGYVFTFQDQTELYKMEARVKNQSSSRGHIAKYSFDDILGSSGVIESCKEKARKIAQLDNVVLITGESGTGKELFAQSLHNASKRSKMPFLAINCSALNPHLLESELFGYEEGAFSGAKKGGKRGLFELADKGTLFLDEIGELPLAVQAKFLRILQEKELIRVGGSDIITVDVRIIAATNRSLLERVEKRAFRKDLYYRLSVFPLLIPNLRERSEDVLPLTYQFLKEFGESDKRLHTRLENFLVSYSWPGNVRELRNCIEYMAYMGGNQLTLNDLPPSIEGQPYKASLDQSSQQSLGDLSKHQSKLATLMLRELDERPLGRRALHKKALEAGLKVTEYDVRKIMVYLLDNAYLEAGSGRKGARITNKAKDHISF